MSGYSKDLLRVRDKEKMKKIFSVNVNKYVKESDFDVYYPASLDYPKDYAVTFLSEQNIERSNVFEKCKNCLIFWPVNYKITEQIKAQNHAIVLCDNPRLQFCQFFEDNEIDDLPVRENYKLVDGAYICEGAVIGKNVLIQPGAYISGEAVIGDNSYIGLDAKILGRAIIGKNVVIRENTIIGADGLTTDRNAVGKHVKMPQFGGTVIGNDVVIGANSVIARGAIDDTVIGSGTSIDNCVFVSHNVQVGEGVFIVGESILFGSSKIGDRTLVSGNATIRNGVIVGSDAVVGMGAVVTKNVADRMVVKGNPAE